MLSAIGAHIYAGGFTVGVARHFEVLAHLEHSGYGADVVRLNFPGMPIHAGGPASWPKEWPKGARRPRFIYANPPCAIWSSASGRHGEEWRTDPRLAMHHDIYRYATEAVGVDVLAVESVPPSFTRGRDHVDTLIERAATLGYSSTVVLHDARYLGVAQRRSRVFYVFHRVRIDWETPDFETDAPTVREVLKSLGRYRTAGFDPRASMSRARADLLRHAGPGEKLRQVYDRLYPDPPLGDRGQKVGRPSFLDQRVSWDKPAPVLIQDKLYHPVEDRLLYQEELASICSFPPDYRWPKASSGDVSGWMSRGVMPKVGEWLAENVARALEKNRRLNEPAAQVLDITGPPERTYPLTEENDMPRVQAPTPAAKAAGSLPRPFPADLPPRDQGEGSGAYIRRLLLLGATPEAILERVHAQFPGSKATASDVAYNKGKLKKDGLWPANGAANGASNGHASNGHAAPAAKAPKHGAPVPAKAAAPPWETPVKPAKPVDKAAAIPDESLSYAVLRGRVSALSRQTPTRLALVELAKVVTAALDAMEALQ